MSDSFYTERDWGLIDQLKRQRRVKNAVERTVQQKFDVYEDWFSTLAQRRIQQGDRQEQRMHRVSKKILEREALVASLDRSNTA